MLFVAALMSVAVAASGGAGHRAQGCDRAPDDASPAAAASVRFAYLDHGIYVQPTIAGRIVGWFLLDTGSGAVVVDRRVARRLALRVVDTATVEGTTGRQRAEIVAIDTLSIGCFDQPGIFAAATDLSAMPAPDGGRLAGVIGYDILQSLSVRIDFAERKLTLSAAAAPVATVGTTRVGFVIDGSAPRLDAVFDGRFQTSLRLDTGLGSAGDEAYATLPSAVWSRLGRSGGSMSAPVGARGVGGSVSLGAIRVRDLAIGDAHVAAPWVLGQAARGYFARSDAAGLVGNSFLERFSPVTIDYISSALYLTMRTDVAACGERCRDR